MEQNDAGERKNRIFKVLKEYNEPGLYLFFHDDQYLVLTESIIETRAREILNDKSKIPDEMRSASDYQNCNICPKKNTHEFCSALYPLLAIFKEVERYFSYVRVMAVYKDGPSSIISCIETDTQHAMQYVSTLSLIKYCETGQKYWKYFWGIMPLMPPREVVNRIYLNIYWLEMGDMNKIRKTIAQFFEDISVIVDCQLKRLKLITKHDGLLNALVGTHITAQLLSINMDKMLHTTFESFEKSRDTFGVE